MDSNSGGHCVIARRRDRCSEKLRLLLVVVFFCGGWFFWFWVCVMLEVILFGLVWIFFLSLCVRKGGWVMRVCFARNELWVLRIEGGCTPHGSPLVHSDRFGADLGRKINRQIKIEKEKEAKLVVKLKTLFCVTLLLLCFFCTLFILRTR